MILAFVPPISRTIPDVQNTTWPQQPIDYFILQGLEKNGILPSSRIDKSALLRRVWFGLLGLPPSPEAIESFLSNQDDRAFIRVVDALLASPLYGERWGRHWLDVARYGDSNGGDENHSYPHSYRYRNWVIDAFNQDIPFDRFAQAQVAGDALPWGDHSTLAGTGFLAIGTKILAEQDPIKKRADTINEQLDALGQAFMGLSIGCARCHDHKFDPITEDDYYAMAGIFYSTDIGVHEIKTPVGLKAEAVWKQRLSALDQRLVQTKRELQGAIIQEMTMEWEAESYDRGNVVVDTEQYGIGIGIIGDPGAQNNFVEYDLEIKSDQYYLVDLRYAAKNIRSGRILFDGHPVFEKAIHSATGGWMPKHQKWLNEGVHFLKTGKHIMRIEYEPMMSHIDKVRLSAVGRADSAKHILELIEKLQIQKTTQENQRPEFTKVMAVGEGKFQNARLNIQGNPHQLGEEVPRGFLSGIGSSIFPKVSNDSSGRRELAEWMTSPDHPLTARVFVNRVWHWHFGKGLVPTPDNFGSTGEAPSHLELLDWLALDFIRSGWSIKHLHRRILLSSV